MLSSGLMMFQRHKPEPDTFLRCAELIGVPPEHCVVFEDADFGHSGRQKRQYGRGRRSHAVSSTLAVMSLFGSSFLSATLLPGQFRDRVGCVVDQQQRFHQVYWCWLQRWEIPWVG
ncbi:Phosphatase YqaB [Serratia fonticola]|uniref:Phosphatase YqaB n=1 Tax=Serratia fonticola TaxID=47917 RepID=A0A4U9VIC6_SERFO|nr:Phosphatase YqaB [Serratia fonticola]